MRLLWQRTAAWLALLAGLLAGCTSGPDSDVLRRDVEARLVQALPEGAVSLVALERRGSQSDPKLPGGQTRRVVYFDAQLKVERNIDFGAWDAPGVAGLVSALGAGPKGIVGIKSGGNQEGDVVRAHGTALYQREGDAWMAVSPAGHRPAEAPAYATNAPQRGPAAMLEAMRKVVDSVSKDASPAQLAVIEEELTAAHATIRARLARAADGYAIAAGPEHGQYLRFAQALSDGKGARTVPLVTQGGEENLELLRAGKVSLALAQGDSALAAYEGSGAFQSSGPYAALRALGSLYPEPVHVLVRADTPAASVADLRGRRVAIGRPGSASRTTALRVLEAHSLSLAEIKPQDLSLTDALVSLRRGEVDAVVQVIGVPADSIRDALASVPLRLLPLSERAIEALARGRSGLFAHTVPRGSYATQGKDVRTVATAALLLVGPDLSETEVGTLTRFVFEKGQDFASRGSAQGLQVHAGTARLGLTVPLHSAAEKVIEAAAPASGVTQ